MCKNYVVSGRGGEYCYLIAVFFFKLTKSSNDNNMERRAVPLCQLSLLLPLDAMQACYRLHYGPICLSV